MKLMKLELTNFKGMKDYTLELDGKDARIRGTNEVGKTTIKDAFMWLITGRDSRGNTEQKFDLKTRDEKGEFLHGLDHVVKATFEKDDGRELTLEKAYSEKWTKKRGSNKERLTGHTTDHKIDGVPVKMGEFEDTVEEELGSDDMITTLTDPLYFGEDLSWEDRRSILLDMCGDVSMEDVIQENPDLGRLPDILDGRSVEQYQKVVHSRKKEINDELEKIPVRIDEKTRDLPDVPPEDLDELEAKKAEIQEEIEGLKEEKKQVGSDAELEDLKGEISTLKSKIRRARNEAKEEADDRDRAIKKKIRNRKRKREDLKEEAERKRRKIDSLQDEIRRKEDRRDQLRSDWIGKDKETFDEDSTICPTCGQDFPEDKAERMREEFRENKAKKLQKIQDKGEKLRDEIAEAEERVEEIRDEIPGEDKIKELDEEIKDLKDQRKDITPDFSDAKPLEDELEDLEEELENRDSSEEQAEKKAEIQEEINDLKGELSEVRDKISEIKQVEKAEKRIEELKQQEEELSAEYEKLDGHDNLMDEYIRSRAGLLQDNVNDMFDLATIQLFTEQQNGGIKQLCDVFYKGNRFDTNVNDGAKVAVGLDIIDTISKHFGQSLPVFVDNAEKIVNMPAVDFQLIELIVDEDYDKLDVTLI